MINCKPGGICGWDCHSGMSRGGIFQLIIGDSYEYLPTETNWHKKGKRGHKQNLAARHRKEIKKRKKKKDKNKKKKRQNKKRKRRKRKDKKDK